MARVYETAIKVGATITKAFSRDTYDAAKALTRLAESTKKLQGAEKSAAAFRKLDDQIARSKARYNTASEALRRLKDAEKAAGGATKESIKWRKAGERELAKAAREMDRATKAAQKHGEALRAAGIDTHNLAREQERLQRTLAATERQHKALGRFQGARERLFGKRSEPAPLMQKAGGQIRGIASDAAFLGTAAVGAGVAIGGLVLKSLKAGDEIGDMAERLGVGTDALQELRHSAKKSGAETGDLDKALGKMMVTVGKFKAAKGKGKDGTTLGGLDMLGDGGAKEGAAETDPFKRLGLSAKKLAGLKPDEQLKLIADGMAKLKTRADRAAVAQAIFGKGAGALVPLLEKGSKGINKLSIDAHKFGGVMSKEAVEAAGLADDALIDAEAAAHGLANTLGAALLPTAVEVFKSFSEWVAKNRGAIQKWADTAAKWITGKAIPALLELGRSAQALAAKVARVVDAVGGLGNAAIIALGLRLAPLAVTLGQIGVSGYKAAAALIRYAAAAKAAKAAGMVDGVGGPVAAGNALGLAAKASLVAGAAAIGYAIGSAIDDHFDFSGKIAKWADKVGGTEEQRNELAATGEGTHRMLLAQKAIEREGLVHQFERQGMSHRKALFAADEQLRTGGGGGSLNFNPTINVGDGPRGDISKQIDEGNAKAKAAALKAYDQREANRQRVQFAE